MLQSSCCPGKGSAVTAQAPPTVSATAQPLPQEVHPHCKACQDEHKRACEERAYVVADEELFCEPPRDVDDCPICFVRRPILESEETYKSCCGKTICSGCVWAHLKQWIERHGTTDPPCPFCRRRGYSSDEEGIQWLTKRVDADDPEALIMLGGYYRHGMNGLSPDVDKAIELNLKAAELGSARAQYFLGEIYCNNGLGEEGETFQYMDMKKALHYTQLSAIGGDNASRHMLGCFEKYRWGNIERSMKHFLMAAKAGNDDALKEVREGYINGHVAKEDFACALRAYKGSVDEVQSDQRDEARKYFTPVVRGRGRK